MGPNGILCTRWEKEYASVRQTFVACDDCLVKNEAYDVEKGANKHKSEHCRPRQCDFKSAVCAAYTRVFGTYKEPQKSIKILTF